MNKNVTYLDSVIVAPTSFSSLLILYCSSLLFQLGCYRSPISFFISFCTVLFPSGTVKAFPPYPLRWPVLFVCLLFYLRHWHRFQLHSSASHFSAHNLQYNPVSFRNSSNRVSLSLSLQSVARRVIESKPYILLASSNFRHSNIMCRTVTIMPQQSQTGGDSFFKRKQCVSLVWPIRSRVRTRWSHRNWSIIPRFTGQSVCFFITWYTGMARDPTEIYCAGSGKVFDLLDPRMWRFTAFNG